MPAERCDDHLGRRGRARLARANVSYDIQIIGIRLQGGFYGREGAAVMHQSWNPQCYSRNAGFVAALGAPLLELLKPQAGERVLDLGCGDGELMRRLSAAGCDVVGIDASAEMVAAASVMGVDARVADAQYLNFAEEFDAVFSNAALPAHERRGFLEEVAARCRDRLCDETGQWTADYVRLRFVAHKPRQS